MRPVEFSGNQKGAFSFFFDFTLLSGAEKNKVSTKRLLCLEIILFCYFEVTILVFIQGEKDLPSSFLFFFKAIVNYHTPKAKRKIVINI